MKATILQLHEEMEQAIGQVAGSRTGTDGIEERYGVAARYWQRVKQEIRQSGFPDDAAEVDFFKNLKSAFTSRLEYYLLLFRYYFHSDAGSGVLEQFREDELQRIRKFRETHTIFIDYFGQGRTEWDDLYFLRRKFNKVQRPPSQVYDRATDFWTNGDWIVTLHLANGPFERFLQSDFPARTVQ